MIDDVLIFSKDRAAQLDLLLRTIARQAPNLYRRTTILYTGSAPDYLQAYAILLGPDVCSKAILENDDLELQVRAWLRTSGPLVSFLVDDDVFYRAPAAGLDGLEPPYSLRGGDYDYPFSLDGNVYRREQVETAIEGVRFRDPTMLEAAVHERRARLPWTTVKRTWPPCLVGIPANRVSVSSGMPHMGLHEYDLNERFLAGGRLELDLDGNPSPVFGTHVTIGYRWT